jgi:hypothetical protein
MRWPSQFHPVRPRLLDALRDHDHQRLVANLGADLPVGIVALPLTMALAMRWRWRSPRVSSPSKPSSPRSALCC